MLEKAFLSALGVSISVGIILLLLFILTPLFRKRLAPSVRRFLWVLLALRLLLPFQYAWPVELVNVPVSSVPFSMDMLPSGAFSRQQDGTGRSDMRDTPEPSGQGPVWSPLRVLTVLWIAGALLFTLYQSIAYCHTRRALLRWAAPPEDEQMTRMLDVTAEKLALKRRPVLLVSAQSVTPLVIGFWRPVLILPHGKYTEEALPFIFRHELTHIKSGDTWVKLCLLAANAMHWYNPLVYWMRYAAALDVESACDDLILAGASFAERRAYSETILSALKTERMRGRTLTTQFYGGVHTMKKRMINILEPIKPRRGAWVAAAVIVCTILLGSLFACTTKVMPQRIDGGFSMGSIFDYAEIGKKSAGVRGLSSDMTASEVMAYYGLAPEDFIIEDVEANPVPNQGSTKWSYYILDQCAFFDETGEIPCTVLFHFTEEGTLKNVEITVHYFGVPWEAAHENALSIFETINRKTGDAITQEEWMQTSDYKGVVYNDFADPLDALSEFGSSFWRQYMYIGSANGRSFAVSMSYQEFSETVAMKKKVDELFAFSITMPVKE